MESVFDFSSYRNFLNHRLGGAQSRTGQKKKAAQALQVHTSLISQILGGNCEISLEQAEKISKFLGLSQEETEYFLLSERRDSRPRTAFVYCFDFFRLPVDG